MRRIRKLALLEFMLSAAAGAAMFCTPSSSVAGRDETIHLRAYNPDASDGAQYSWTVTGGKVEGSGAEADWTLSDVQPMTAYSAKVVVKYGSGGSAECVGQVTTVAGSRGDRETARTLLARGQPEEAGFGLYSYLLIGSPPDDSTRDRSLGVMK